LLVNYHRPKLGLKKTHKNDPNQFYEIIKNDFEDGFRGEGGIIFKVL